MTKALEGGCTEVKTCNEAFAAYLIEVAQVMKPEYYMQFVLYIQCLRRCINLHGWSLLRETQPGLNQEYCSCRDASNLPEISNHFISDFLPQECPSLDRKAAIEMTLHFNKWLYERKLSRLKLSVVAN